MAYEESVKAVSLLANASFETTGQFRFGVINSSGKVALASSAGRVDGVILGNPAADVAVQFGIGGIMMVEYGGSITAGAQVQSGSSGVAVAGTTYVAGIALETGVSGDIRPVLFMPIGA